jgi:transposase
VNDGGLLTGPAASLDHSRKKIAAAVRVPGTSLTGPFGVDPVIAATVIGEVAYVSRYPAADTFASYNGTAPIEVSSGNCKIYRLSMRGNRRLNHVIHMTAVTQIAHKHSEGHRPEEGAPNRMFCAMDGTDD